MARDHRTLQGHVGRVSKIGQDMALVTSRHFPLGAGRRHMDLLRGPDVAVQAAGGTTVDVRFSPGLEYM